MARDRQAVMIMPDRGRKAVARVHRGVSTVTSGPGRLATWIRKDYPRGAPERGHNYLIALCGLEYTR